MATVICSETKESVPVRPVPAQLLRSVSLRFQSPRAGDFYYRVPRKRYWWQLGAENRSAHTNTPPESPNPGAGRTPAEARLEAVLFVAKEPLHARKLSQYANLADGTEALTLIGRLNQMYDQSGRAFRVVEVAGGWQLRTRSQFSRWLRRLPHAPSEVRLSAPAMETLSVIAYRQPVVRAAVETVRGVACGEIIRQLMERGLVRVSGRSEELGRPFFYSTTKRFLEVFGLREIEELPRYHFVTQESEGQTNAMTVDLESMQSPNTSHEGGVLTDNSEAMSAQPGRETIAADDDWEEDDAADDDGEWEDDDDDAADEDYEPADDDFDEDDMDDDDLDEDGLGEDDLEDDDEWGDDEWEEVEDGEEEDDEYEYEYEYEDGDDESEDADDEWEEVEDDELDGDLGEDEAEEDDDEWEYEDDEDDEDDSDDWDEEDEEEEDEG